MNKKVWEIRFEIEGPGGDSGAIFVTGYFLRQESEYKVNVDGVVIETSGKIESIELMA